MMSVTVEKCASYVVEEGIEYEGSPASEVWGVATDGVFYGLSKRATARVS